MDAADKLTQIRQAVDQGYRWDQALRTYSSLQDTFLAVNTAIADTLTSPQAAARLRTAAALAGYKASLAEQGALLAGATEADGFDTDARFNLFKGASADEASQKAVLDSIAGSDAKGAVRDALATPARWTSTRSVTGRWPPASEARSRRRPAPPPGTPPRFWRTCTRSRAASSTS